MNRMRTGVPRWTWPTADPEVSACRRAYATCSSENFERFIGPILSASGTLEDATLLQFLTCRRFWGRRHRF